MKGTSRTSIRNIEKKNGNFISNYVLFKVYVLQIFKGSVWNRKKVCNNNLNKWKWSKICRSCKIENLQILKLDLKNNSNDLNCTIYVYLLAFNFYCYPSIIYGCIFLGYCLLLEIEVIQCEYCSLIEIFVLFRAYF